MSKRTAPTSHRTSNELFGLIVGTYLSTMLLLIRIVFTGRLTFSYMWWNLFLAWVPFVLSHFITKNYQPLRKHPILLVILLLSWLLFLPNAPYVITDLKHWQYAYRIPLWFDLVMLGSFAFNGLYLGLYSLSHIQELLAERYESRKTWFVIGILSYLIGLGIYLGRILRYNSWDILTNPLSIVSDVTARMVNPLAHPGMHLFVIGVTLAFFLFYRAFYATFFAKKSARKVISR